MMVPWVLGRGTGKDARESIATLCAGGRSRGFSALGVCFRAAW
jgi:hypothetical protein